MTNFQQLINEATKGIVKTVNTYHPENMLYSTEIYVKAGASLPNELLLKALEALEFECGNRCATGLNQCNARDVIEEIKSALEGAGK